MKSLITGGVGFVGRTLAAHLSECGDTVVTTDRASGGPDMADRESVLVFLARHEVEVVYHLAGQAHVPTSWSDPIGTFRSNVEGTINVLDAAHGSGVRRCIAVTSAEVYGQVAADAMPIVEDTALRPRNPYAASKVAADAVAVAAHLGRGQDVIRMRAFNHIGPGQNIGFVAAGLASRVAAVERIGEGSVAVGNLDSRRDFTDVRDVVRAYRAVAEMGTAGEAYNVCSGIHRSVEDVAVGLIAHSNSSPDLVVDPDFVRSAEVDLVVGDNSKLRAETGWKPLINFGDSLRDILQDARYRLDGADR